MKLLLLSFAIIFLSCTEHRFTDDSYKPFEMTSEPDDTKTYYPEESLTFSFNSDINHAIVEQMSFVDAEENEYIPTIEINQNSLTVSDLPSQMDITLSFLSGCRSADNRLLTQTTEYGITTQDMVYHFHIGPALPHLTSILPKEQASATLALEFSDSIRIKEENITPTPKEFIKESATLILLYDNPQKKIVLSGVTTPIRPGILPDITIEEEEKDAVTCALDEANITTDDDSIEIIFSGNCLLAFRFEQSVAICPNGKCIIKKEDLKSDFEYSFSATLFTIEGPIEKNISVRTEVAKAHVMISEVMHSPSRTPEKSHEFVEIYNFSSLPFDLKDCLIDDKNDGKGIDPLLGDETILAPGATALIVGNESLIIAPGSGENLLFFVDDTTIADAGLTSTESIQIICPGENGEQIVASYNASAYGSRGYSAVIEEDGTMCDSPEAGGTPGFYSECP